MILGLAAILLHAGAYADSAPETMVLNGDFEDGVESWHWWFNQPEPVEVNVLEDGGNRCVQFVGGPKTRVAFYQNVQTQPEQWYRVRFRYWAGPKGPGGGSLGSFNTRMIDANAKHFDYPCAMPLLDTFGKWTQAEKCFQAPLSAAQVTIEFNSAGPCDLRIDDVSVAAIDPPEDTRPPNTWEQFATPREDRIWLTAWHYATRAKPYRQQAMKYGWRYRYDEQIDLFKETRTLTWAEGGGPPALATEKGIPACPYIHYAAQRLHKAHYGGKPPKDVPYLLDPVFHDAYVTACREYCETIPDPPGIEYIFVEDEMLGHYAGSVLPKEKRESDREVREEFGGGKWGLPESTQDRNPFRWIAYYSWAGQQMVRTFERVRLVIDETDCGAMLLGPDEAQLYPLPWCDLAKTVDVFTGQSLSYRIGAHKYHAGFETKCAADMTGKRVHGAAQIVMYAGSPSPEEVQRRYSQILQNGGDGVMMIAEEWGDRDLGHHQYAAPGRWETLKNLLALISTNTVRTPHSSTVGILSSSPSIMALGRQMRHPATEAAYAFCGPILGGWPRMIDSYALARGKADLQGLSVVILPYAPYERPETLAALEQFVAGGGLLICADPQSLKRDTVGKMLRSRTLLGSRAKRVSRRRSVVMDWPVTSRQRAYAEDAFTLTPLSNNVQVIGRYEDQSPAVTMNPYGQGHVVVFGSNPLANEMVAEDAEWTAWWEALLACRNVRMGLPIWDLRLPDSALVHAEKPTDVCITGNNFVRCQNGAYLGANAPVDGHYTMSVAPDVSRESAGEGKIPFAKGDLTDRTEADKGPFKSMRIPKDPYKEADWANRWSAEAMADGLVVEFSLPAPQALTRVRFWYSGAMPDLTVEAERGGDWVVVSQADGEDVGEDVSDVDLGIKSETSRLRLRFGPGKSSFALADVELWAKP